MDLKRARVQLGLRPLFLATHSLFRQGWGGTRIHSITPEQKFKDSQLGGLSVGPWAPKELVVCHITVGYLRVQAGTVLAPKLW